MHLCKDCRHWDREPLWPADATWSEARRCMLFALEAVGIDHCGGEPSGRPATLPSFGCVQWATREAWAGCGWQKYMKEFTDMRQRRWDERRVVNERL